MVPRIEMVEKEVELLRELLPDARVDFAHSGIPQLEEVHCACSHPPSAARPAPFGERLFSGARHHVRAHVRVSQRIVSFTLGETDVLVATTILENGIDIPNVNTIIIQSTHMFGLAQLHQLRGRVGRAAVQAYAYLMHPRQQILSDDARQRLRVVQRESALGAGFGLARSDLAMRGSGNIFGEAQKGASGVADIGVDMYVEVLQKAMRFLEAKRKLGLPDDAELDDELLQQSVDEVMLMSLDDSLAL